LLQVEEYQQNFSLEEEIPYSFQDEEPVDLLD